MRKQTDRVRQRVLTGATAVVLLLAALAAWAQDVNEGELGSTAGRTFRFVNNTGPQRVVQSAPQIVGIGEMLARGLAAGGRRSDYFGKYSAIRAFDPGSRLLSADIIVLGRDARIDNIRNVQRIVAGYLSAAFGYKAAQADGVAVLVTNYNAAIRGDLATLTQKYAPVVMSNLGADNAGIALRYSEWPGKTRLVIPLAVAAVSAGAAAGTGTAPGTAPGATSGAAPGAAGASSAAASGTSASGASGIAAGSGTSAAGAAAATGASTGPGTTASSGAAASGIAPAGVAEGVIAGGEPTVASAGGGVFGLGRWSLYVLVAVLILAGLGLIGLLVIQLRRLGLDRAWIGAMYSAAREGHPLVEMVVTTQNRRIGFRNVHYLRSGSSVPVGGGRSTFLVFLVPVPRRIATLSYDGQTYTFTPERPELFPDTAGPVDDCLGKEIRAQSPRGYPFAMVFRRFVSPLDEINRLMRSIHPGSA